MQSGFVQMRKGDIVFEYRLPNIAGASYDKLAIQSNANADLTVQIWNGKRQDWEPFSLGESIVWDAKQLEPYLINGKILRMKAVMAEEKTRRFFFPSISLEGTVKP